MTNISFFGQLLLELCDHIKNEVPEVRWVDQDLGQLENYDQRPAVSFPCVLIDFAATTYDDMAENAQIGYPTILVRIGVNPFSKSNQTAPTEVREKAVAYYDLEQKVHQCLQGWNNEFTNALARRSADTENRNDGLRVRLLTYETTYEDYSCLPINSKVAAQLNIDQDLLD
jgi:hypothetical protein